MISAEKITEIAVKYQTTELNISREYCQHLFLANFYKKKEAERILFKGGTALRFLYGSPRFSEGLDFSAYRILQSKIEELLESNLVEIEREGMKIEIMEAKETTGGYLAIIEFRFHHYIVPLTMEVSLRELKATSGVTAVVKSEYIPAYTLVHLAEEILVSEKLKALLTRSKPRDFFDLYFILRSHLKLAKNRKTGEDILKVIMGKEIDFKGEMREFLPKSQYLILKDLKTILKEEVKRYFLV